MCIASSDVVLGCLVCVSVQMGFFNLIFVMTLMSMSAHVDKSADVMHQSFVTTVPPPTGKGGDYYLTALSSLL